MTAPKDHKMMDDEDLGIELDKLHASQQGKSMEIDQDKVKNDVDVLVTLAKSGQTQQAIDGLLSIEKQGRLAEDITSTRIACTTILEILHNAGDWKGIQEQIMLLSKRRGQLKQAIQAMVRQCMSYYDAAPNQSTKIELIKTLQALTEGKIYVEIERARLTRELACIKEEEGNIEEAAEILQEVAVETFGAMAKTEKIAYILEQVRLCLARKDYVRAQILSKKISPRAFIPPVTGAKKGENTGEIGIEGTAIEAPAPGTPSLETLKLHYYNLMVQYHAHDSNYLEMCRCYRAILDTPSVEENQAAWGAALRKAAWYAVLAPRDSDQRTLLAATKSDRRLDDMPVYKDLLNKMSGKEVLWWKTLQSDLADEMHAMTGVFGADADNGVALSDGSVGETRRKDFRKRVIEHNIYTLSEYYSRMTLARLGQMLDLPEQEAEQSLCDMVTTRGLAAKVDRPSGLVKFGERVSPEDALNQWSGRVGKLLTLIEKTCQQIQKESQVHKVPLGV